MGRCHGHGHGHSHSHSHSHSQGSARPRGLANNLFLWGCILGDALTHVGEFSGAVILAAHKAVNIQKIPKSAWIMITGFGILFAWADIRSCYKSATSSDDAEGSDVLCIGDSDDDSAPVSDVDSLKRKFIGSAFVGDAFRSGANTLYWLASLASLFGAEHDHNHEKWGIPKKAFWPLIIMTPLSALGTAACHRWLNQRLQLRGDQRTEQQIQGGAAVGEKTPLLPKGSHPIKQGRQFNWPRMLTCLGVAGDFFTISISTLYWLGAFNEIGDRRSSAISNRTGNHTGEILGIDHDFFAPFLCIAVVCGIGGAVCHGHVNKIFENPDRQKSFESDSEGITPKKMSCFKWILLIGNFMAQVGALSGTCVLVADKAGAAKKAKMVMLVVGTAVATLFSVADTWSCYEALKPRTLTG